MSEQQKTLREIVQDLVAEKMRCYCDLDNWQPERDTGHSWVCPIHKTAKARHKKAKLSARGMRDE